VALGALLLVLGLAGAGAANFLQFTSVLIFGPLLLASSIFQFLMALAVEQRRERLMHLAAAAVEMVLGFLIMANPFADTLNLMVAIAAFLIIAGVLRLARAVAAQSQIRGWTLLAGAVAVLLGISIWTGWPGATLWFAGLCVAIDLVCHGISWLGIALAERKAPQPLVS
jgi:uncharacterized membrane protein HdeD (DUF308 family)